ncbi:hypothetical protein V493_00790 [Pseudogymnoascus sp. VKM F-4281 (FW-2241)]|nr:hypothetical protein V493_00790 [Pseudogymnoascus sp. VKM F-4281 (FW-2241)]
MMDLLGSYYLTGNETEQAWNEFDDMQMGQKGHSNETFPEFKARFQSAAITRQLRSSYQEPMERRLPDNGPRAYCIRLGTAKEQRIEPAPRINEDELSTYRRNEDVSTETETNVTAYVYEDSVPPETNYARAHFQDKCPLNATVKEIDRNDPETEES